MPHLVKVQHVEDDHHDDGYHDRGDYRPHLQQPPSPSSWLHAPLASLEDPQPREQPLLRRLERPPPRSGIPDVIETTPSRRRTATAAATPPLPGGPRAGGTSSSSSAASGANSSCGSSSPTSSARRPPLPDRFWMGEGDDDHHDCDYDDDNDREFSDRYPKDHDDSDPPPPPPPPHPYDDDGGDRGRMVLLDPYYHRHVPPPPIPSPSVVARTARPSRPRRGHHHHHAHHPRRPSSSSSSAAAAVERRRPSSSHRQQQVPIAEPLRASSSSSNSSANDAGGYNPSSSWRSGRDNGSAGGGSRRSGHRRRSSSGGGGTASGEGSSGVSRRTSGAAAAGGGGRRSSLAAPSGRRKPEAAPAGAKGGGWWGRSPAALSSSRALFRMISFAGILSVSLTALANRNLLLVQVDPLAAAAASGASSPGVLWQQQHQQPPGDPSAGPLYYYYASRTRSTASSLLALSSSSSRTEAAPSSPGLLRGKLLGSRPGDGGGRRGVPGGDARASARSDPPGEGAGSLLLLLAGRREDGTSSSRRRGLWAAASPVALPAVKLSGDARRHFDPLDRNLYTYRAPASPTPIPTSGSPAGLHPPVWNRRRRVAVLHDEWNGQKNANARRRRRKLQLYPPDITDPTQLYPVLDSRDERAKTMERRPPLEDGECVPMQEWQTTYHPSCNQLHEALDVARLGAAREKSGSEFFLFGTKGYWRNAWKVRLSGPRQRADTMVLKTLKIEHRFEEKVYEHNRIDAIAMERLTKSPHVINIFGFCGNSVLTEYADGKRLGELADKSKKQPLARLRIARDIAQGLADVHGIDGDGNATFVHLDINPANVVSIGGTLKLNDFNIGILRRRNRASGAPCGFPAQYPNPQWRSPEEARGEPDLTEKVDVFSMGHIFFRLICGHEPWNKLEPGGKPGKAEVNGKVEKGILPHIPPDILESKDPEEAAIRDAMLRCYTFDPAERPSARFLADRLQEELRRLEAERDGRAAAPN